jgi:CheY-like chemotaxis protein
VLVVDDVEDIAEVTKLVLELRGCSCEIATSGRAALAVAETFQPQVAILDLGLPDVSGFDLAAQIRERVKCPLHLAAVTGWNGHDVETRSLAAGFDQYILKPTSAEILDRILRAAAARRAHA